MRTYPEAISKFINYSNAAINGEPPTAPATGTFSKNTVTIISGSFEPIADEHWPREGHVVASYNGMIWSISGVNDFGPAPPVRTYTPETNTWKEVADSQAPFGEVLFYSGYQVYETVYMYVDFPESSNNGDWDSSTRYDKLVPKEECPPLPTYLLLYQNLCHQFTTCYFNTETNLWPE